MIETIRDTYRFYQPPTLYSNVIFASVFPIIFDVFSAVSHRILALVRYHTIVNHISNPIEVFDQIKDKCYV